MTLNDSINALVYKNTLVPPVNQTTFNNPFLLLSSTRALNELVSNTTPSSRAKVADIEPKTQFQRDPTGKAINVYTKDKLTKPSAKPMSATKTAFGRKEDTIAKLVDASRGKAPKKKVPPKPKPIASKPQIKAKKPKKQPAGVNMKLNTMSLKKKAKPKKETVKVAPYQMYTGY